MLSTLHKRMALFLIGCMGTRLLCVYIAKVIQTQYLPLLGYLAYYAINKNRNSWMILLIDVIVGLFSFLMHHFKGTVI